MKEGLKPICEKDSKILILGSLPGEESIKNQRYYDNKFNHFWKLLSFVFEDKYIDFNNYEEKISFLQKHKIALWDVIKCADREGSLDNNIKNEEYNDLDFVFNNSSIDCVYVNGRKAEASLKKYMELKEITIIYKYLPSSSALNTKHTALEKSKLWKKIIKG